MEYVIHNRQCANMVVRLQPIYIFYIITPNGSNYLNLCIKENGLNRLKGSNVPKAEPSAYLLVQLLLQFF